MSRYQRQHRNRPKTDVFICDSSTPEAYKCEFCDFRSDLKVILTHHLETVHEEKEVRIDIDSPKEHLCDQCGFQSFSQLVILGHCCSTGSGYTDSSFLVKVNADESDLTTPCEVVLHDHCYFSQEELLKQDVVKKPVKRKMRYFNCKYCPFKSDSVQATTVHIYRVHTHPSDLYWFYCPYCFYKSETGATFRRHVIANHTDDGNNCFYCEHCTFQSTSRNHLEKHIFAQHTQHINWFCCERCPFKSQNKEYLENHVILKHTKSEDVVWFHCNHCESKSQSKEWLKNHIVHNHTKSVKSVL